MQTKNLGLKFLASGKNAWGFLRTLSNDNAYERYLEHWQECHADQNTAPLTRREFFVREQERKWNGIRRCC